MSHDRSVRNAIYSKHFPNPVYPMAITHIIARDEKPKAVLVERYSAELEMHLTTSSTTADIWNGTLPRLSPRAVETAVTRRGKTRMYSRVCRLQGLTFCPTMQLYQPSQATTKNIYAGVLSRASCCDCVHKTYQGQSIAAASFTAGCACQHVCLLTT